MSVGTLPQMPAYYSLAGFHQLSVAQYHKMIEVGVLTKDDRVELLEGYMVQKMSQNPPHFNIAENAGDTLRPLLPNGWRIREEKPITLIDSEPEPDLVIVRGDRSTFASRHPGPSDIGIVIEVSDSSVAIDRKDKTRIYARADLPNYWIINVVDRQVEVYADPKPNDHVPGYARRTDYRPGDAVPLILDGQSISQILVNDLLG
jgi:Uma2 family endonuclease